MTAQTALRKVMVTGGAGFIGSNVVRLLCDRGYDVIVIDDMSTGYRALVDPRARLVDAAFDDSAVLDDLLPGTDVVMHLAASSIIRFSIEHPLRFVENNVWRGARLLERMRLHGVRRIINSSTAAVYGEPDRVPISEDHPLRPLQPYGASKLAFEAFLSAYSHSYGFSTTSFRYFNAYGPNDCQVPVTRAVPRWIRNALAGEALELNWGGRQLRDYIYVDDIAYAHLLAIDLSGHRVLNLGSGEGVMMSDLANRIIRLTGSSSPLVDAGPREGDPANLVADTARVRYQLGWIPTVPLEEGLRRTVDFYRSGEACSASSVHRAP